MFVRRPFISVLKSWHIVFIFSFQVFNEQLEGKSRCSYCTILQQKEMKRETYNATNRRGLVVAISLIQNNPGMLGEEENIPYSSQQTEESAGQEPVENLPPEQPDVYP